MQRRNLTKDVRGALRLVVILPALLGGPACATAGARQNEAPSMGASKATVTISPSPVEYKRKVKVTISGSGFKPRQQLGLLLDVGGAPSDISGLVEPKPVTNEKGEFSSVWVIDQEINRKLLSPTSHTIEVIDEEWRTLAQATLAFQAPEKKEEKK